ncbi:pyridoxal-dependent decarboxylase [Legionella quinlivanii]|uniref:Pyridoxal-dependent decarboxylase n=2 Tax=Legionella quinlivanii TaxID=45073 RepID=A0A0W0Y3A7_9GAMM|nr:pyridoxal-dependent decarboxylase [Legionella quinlivanii]SEF56146.1 histidine decarboxylase [Legionella quinlivanii DSM 21216]STY11006.1 pyridoxal-dependent decarboxylase [Legionella quinlivanii]
MNDMPQKLAMYLAKLKEKTTTHAGYPYNLNYNYDELIPFLKFSLNNLGDPFVQSNYQIESREFELEVLEFFAELYKCSNWWGYITHCGTESNLHAMLLAREYYPNGVLYFSEDTHYSIKKAAKIFCIPYKEIKSQSNGELDYQQLYDELDSTRPVILNLNIGTTFKGAIDDINQISACFEEKGIKEYYIHCDAALGGMLVPYLAPDMINFHANIHSIAISGHKFIGVPFPCGIILTYKSVAKKFCNFIEYLNSNDATISGSRNGHAALFLWYSIMQRKDEFKNEVETCRQNAEYFAKKMNDYQQNCLLNNYSTTLVFNLPSPSMVDKWQLAVLGKQAHFIVMQNHSKETIDQFINEYLAF